MVRITESLMSEDDPANGAVFFFNSSKTKSNQTSDDSQADTDKHNTEEIAGGLKGAEDKNKSYEVPVIIDDTELGHFEGTTDEFNELIKTVTEEERVVEDEHMEQHHDNSSESENDPPITWKELKEMWDKEMRDAGLSHLEIKDGDDSLSTEKMGDGVTKTFEVKFIPQDDPGSTKEKPNQTP